MKTHVLIKKLARIKSDLCELKCGSINELRIPDEISREITKSELEDIEKRLESVIDKLLKELD